MKKITIIIAILAISFAGFSQTQDTVSKKKSIFTNFRPYFSPGASLSGGLATYGMEVGVYTDAIWITTSTEITNNGAHTTPTVVEGLRFYYNAYTPVKDRLFLYVNAAGKVQCNGENRKMLIFEPGSCLVYSPQKNIGIQWGISFPIPENIVTTKTFPFSTGLSFNIYL